MLVVLEEERLYWQYALSNTDLKDNRDIRI